MDHFSLRLSHHAAGLLALSMMVILVACGDERASGTANNLFGKDRRASSATSRTFLPAEPSAGTGQSGDLEPRAAVIAAAENAPISEPINPDYSYADTAEWLVMLYLNADDNMLERDILLDLNEAERIGSTDRVIIVAQIDRYEGAFSEMGDWTTTKRFFLTQDDDLNNINSPELADLGESNMADGETLEDFITWAVARYPARKHALIMSDHGSGWPGGYGDPNPGGRGDHDLYLASSLGDNLWLMELDGALDAARTRAGIHKLELIGLDACLMSQLEVYTALAPHARYAVASEELEPGLGWAYAAFLAALTASPGMDGAGLAQAIVDSYIEQDQRLLDSSALAQFAADHNIKDTTDRASIATKFLFDATLSAIDLGEISSLNAALDYLAEQLIELDRKIVAEARTYTQSFENIFDADLPSPYIDLGHFALWLRDAQHSGSAQVALAADQLLTALRRTVIFERHGAGRPGATGISIFFPTRELFELGENLGYAAIANRFAKNHRWDDFLAAYFSGERRGAFDEASGPSKPLQIAPLVLSTEIATPNQPISVRTEIAGDQLGFLYSFVGRMLPDEELLVIEDIDYLFSDETRFVGGVAYPVWTTDRVTVNFEWEPNIYTINDGVDAVPALLAPDTYGDVPTYATEGTFVFVDGSDSVYAKLFFREGELAKVYGYAGSSGLGAPHEITPQPGDRFIVWEQGIDLRDESEQEKFSRDGGILTFGEEQLWIDTVPAPSGSYIVGVLAEDLSGEVFSEFEAVFLEDTRTSYVEGFVPYASKELGFALLYPESWTINEEPEEATTTFVADYGATLAAVVRDSFPEAASKDEANDIAMRDVMNSFDRAGDLHNVQLVTEIEDFILGGFDAKTIDFTFDLDGRFFYGSVIVATPVPEATFAFLILSLYDDYSTALDDFNLMLQSFDILISGVSKEHDGPPPPDFDQVLGFDDFSDPNSGLEQTREEWGTSTYADSKQYVVELNPYAGPIYDYYVDWRLPEAFMLQVTTGYAGAADNGYGLIFQFIGDGQFYVFRISGDGLYTVERADGDELATLIEWTPSELINQAESSGNVLTLEAHGDTYLLFINGHMVNSFSDPAYHGGTFGIIVDNFDEQSAARFFFDDVIVGSPAE